MVDHDRVEDAYEKYLWGEDSLRAFVRRLKIGGRKNSQDLIVQIDGSVDPSEFVPR